MNTLCQITPFQCRTQSILLLIMMILFVHSNNFLHIVFMLPIVDMVECFDCFQGLHIIFGNSSIGDGIGGGAVVARRKMMMIVSSCCTGIAGGRGKNHSHYIRWKF